MVLKFDSDMDDVYMLEATGSFGVALNKWSVLKEHVGPDQFYHKLIFRHIDFTRDDQMAENLEGFLKESIGLQYGIGIDQLKRMETVGSKESDKKFVDSDRAFFCSELVAKAFKVIGVTEDDAVSCSQFYPHHFSQKG